MSNDLSGKTHTAVSGSDGSTAYINMAYSMAALRGEVGQESVCFGFAHGASSCCVEE